MEWFRGQSKVSKIYNRIGDIDMDKRYSIGFIGCGQRCIDILKEMEKREEFNIVALSDVSDENMDITCNTYNKNWDKYSDYKELLKRKDIDCVVITSPDWAHEEQAVAAFEAGKHVFLEKPVAITVSGAERVLNARDKADKILLIGFVLRYVRLFKKMKKVIEEGLIGELKTGWVLHSVAMGSDWYFHDWHGLMENTGGLLLQKGSHDFDIINWVVNSKIKKVSAFGSRDFFGGEKSNDLQCPNCAERRTCSEFTEKNRMRKKCAFRQEVDVLDNHQVIVEYQNGVKMSYMECHYTPDDNREFTFIGTKGKLKLDFANDMIEVRLRHGMYDSEEKIVFKNLLSGEGHGGGDKLILNDLINSLSTGKQPLAGGEEGMEAIRVGLMAHQSINEGKVIEM